VADASHASAIHPANRAVTRVLRTPCSVTALVTFGSVTAHGPNLNGAGSSFAYPIYSKWAAIYARHTGVKVNCQSIGSSGGIRRLSDETVDFDASDGPMTDEQMRAAKGKALVAFLRWAPHAGEREAAGLDYAPLPPSMVRMLDVRLNEINVAAR